MKLTPLNLDNFFLAGECTDRGYKNVRDLAHHESTRLRIQEMWRQYAPLADDHFLKDAKNHFLQRFWEMYVGVTFSERGLTPVRAGGKGPEFFIESCNKRIWIEAIAPGPGEGADRVDEPENGVVYAVPTERILLRFTHALVEKQKNYAKACEQGIVSASDAYILAINSRGIPHAPYGGTIPYFVQAYLPFGALAVAVDSESLEVVDSYYQYRDAVHKLNGESISTKAFLDPDFSFCSAVLHSSVDCANHPTKHGGDFCILHNPNALHPIDPAIFSWARQLTFKNNRIIELAKD